jgi:hypothetical protein
MGISHNLEFWQSVNLLEISWVLSILDTCNPSQLHSMNNPMHVFHGHLLGIHQVYSYTSTDYRMKTFRHLYSSNFQMQMIP